MREIISIHVGGAGVALGGQVFELFSLERGINRDGTCPKEEGLLVDEDLEFKSFFHEYKKDIYKPRCLFLDLEPSSMEEIQFGAFRRLYDQKSFVCSKECSGSSYAWGLQLGRDILDLASDRIRKLADDCTNLDGFIVNRSVGGGTGSALGNLIMDSLEEQFPKKNRIGFTIYPSHKNSFSFVEPYHTVLSSPTLLSKCDVNFVFDNESIIDICQKKLRITNPSFGNLNLITSQVISSLTGSLRNDGALNVDLNELQTNLVPIPRINGIVTSYSQFQSNEYRLYPHSVITMTEEVFQKDSFFASIDPNQGKYLACCLMYRGMIVPADVGRAVSKIKTDRTIQFVEWSPTGFKCGINYKGPSMILGGILARMDRSVCLLGNSTSVQQVFSRICGLYDRMYEKKAFLHWYVTKGMEEDEFVVAREDLLQLESDYEDMLLESGGEDDGEVFVAGGEESDDEI